MNWLAHLHLSEPTPAFRLGSLLPDMVAYADLANLPAQFQPGIGRHRQIDVYTDSHPLFKRSVQRLNPPYRRFGGILVDVFYDHFLARHWDDFSGTPLPDFVAGVYADLQTGQHLIPEGPRFALQRMQAENWLCSYREIDGIRTTLGRIGRRLRRPVDLAAGASILENQHSVFYEDFSAFYPELQAHVAGGVG